MIEKLMNEESYKANLKNKTVAELKYTIQDAFECIQTWFESGNSHYYLKEIEFCAKELSDRIERENKIAVGF